MMIRSALTKLCVCVFVFSLFLPLKPEESKLFVSDECHTDELVLKNKSEEGGLFYGDWRL